MSTGATSTNVPQNAYTQQAATNTFNDVNTFGSMPNYPLQANNAYTPNVYNADLFSPNTYNPADTVSAGNALTSAGQSMFQPANQVMQEGLDPQMSQFQFYDQQMVDAMRAAAGASGVGTTPYATGVENQGQSDFINQWAMNASQKADAALNAYSGAYGTAGSLIGSGQSLAMAAPALQSTELSQLLASLEQNYSFPQANVNNNLGYMSAANAQNQTAVQSAQQQNQAALLNSPFAFLGALGGSFAPKVSLTAPLSSTPLLG